MKPRTKLLMNIDEAAAAIKHTHKGSQCSFQTNSPWSAGHILHNSDIFFITFLYVTIG